MLLLRGLAIARLLAAKFALLDRDRNLPLLRSIMLASSGIALGCAALLLGLAFLGPSLFDGEGARGVSTPADVTTTSSPIELQQSSEIESVAAIEPDDELDADDPEAEPEALPEPDPEPVAEVEPDATSEPASAAAPTQRSPPGDWRLARVVASGEVTLRAWPNGTALSLLSPGDRVLTQEEYKSAGGHTWERIRLPDGTTGWVVERFVAP